MTILLLGLIVLSGCAPMVEHSGLAVSGNPTWLKERLGHSQSQGVSDANLMAAQTVIEERTPRADLKYDMLEEPATSTVDVMASWAEPFAPQDQTALGRMSSGGAVLVAVPGRDANAPLIGLPVSGTNRPSRLELLYNQQGLASGKNLRQFGYDMFTSWGHSTPVQASMLPETQQTRLEQFVGPWRQVSDSEGLGDLLFNVLSGPVDSEYLIGPGDEILLSTSGAIELSETLIVDRNGVLFIPKVGSVTLAGVPASQLETQIRTAFSKQFSNTVVEVTLGRLQSVRVLVMGHVSRPGLQVVPGNSTLIELLFTVGGPTKDGSLRDVVIRRRNGEVIRVDLYDLYREDPEIGDAVVLAGDVVYVGPIGSTAALVSPSGQGIYELAEGETLRDLLTYAGNLNSFTRLESVRLERTVKQRGREVVILNEATMLDHALGDGDIVFLSEVSRRLSNMVTLTGAVMHPAEYPHRDGMRISDLLRLGGGFLVDAHLERAVLRRRIGKQGTFDIMPRDQRGRLRQETLWVDLAGILAGDEQADRSLRRLDVLEILTRNDVQDAPAVTIIGAIRRPGVYDLTVGLTLRDLLRLAGDPTEDAFAGQSTLVRRVIRDDQRQFDVKLVHFNLTDTLDGAGLGPMRLENADQVIIRRVQSLEVRVQIDGRVQFPGTYVLPDGAAISDLLVAAGGLLPDADLRATMFTRERIRSLQEQHLGRDLTRSQERFARTRDQVTRDGHVSEAVANHMSLLGLGRANRNMLRYQALGRIVIDLERERFPESTDNLTLETGDRIVIPRLTHTVMVMGRVFNPNAFVWSDDVTVGEYLEQAGGFEEDADKKHVYVITASGLVRSMSQTGRLRLSRRHVPGPGDTIIVPARPLGRSTLRMLGDQIALARSAAELGLVGVTAGKVIESPGASVSTGLDLGTSPQPIPSSVGRPYDEMLIREKALQDQ